MTSTPEAELRLAEPEHRRANTGLNFMDSLARGVGARVSHEPCSRGAAFLCEAA